MCFDTDSTPPIPPRHQASSAAATPVTLTSTDGTSFAAFLARPEQSTGVGIVVLPDARGLFHFYELLAERLAEQGHTALAIDYFGRTAGLSPRDDKFPFMEHIVQVTRQTIDADVAAAGDYLRGPSGGNCGTVFALGFCFGGRQAFLASASRFGFAGAVGFYGMPGFYPNGAAGPTQHAADLSAPILGLFGGADGGIPLKEIEGFDAALNAAGVKHEFVIYPGAPHSFFDIKYSEHAEACSDAWNRVLAFVKQHSTPPES